MAFEAGQGPRRWRCSGACEAFHTPCKGGARDARPTRKSAAWGPRRRHCARADRRWRKVQSVVTCSATPGAYDRGRWDMLCTVWMVRACAVTKERGTKGEPGTGRPPGAGGARHPVRRLVCSADTTYVEESEEDAAEGMRAYSCAATIGGANRSGMWKVCASTSARPGAPPTPRRAPFGHHPRTGTMPQDAAERGVHHLEEPGVDVRHVGPRRARQPACEVTQGLVGELPPPSEGPPAGGGRVVRPPADGAPPLARHHRDTVGFSIGKEAEHELEGVLDLAHGRRNWSGLSFCARRKTDTKKRGGKGGGGSSLSGAASVARALSPSGGRPRSSAARRAAAAAGWARGVVRRGGRGPLWLRRRGARRRSGPVLRLQRLRARSAGARRAGCRGVGGCLRGPGAVLLRRREAAGGCGDRQPRFARTRAGWVGSVCARDRASARRRATDDQAEDEGRRHERAVPPRGGPPAHPSGGDDGDGGGGGRASEPAPWSPTPGRPPLARCARLRQGGRRAGHGLLRPAVVQKRL